MILKIFMITLGGHKGKINNSCAQMEWKYLTRKIQDGIVPGF